MPASIRLLGLGQDNNSSFLAGPAQAPATIREAIRSPSANMFSECGIDLGDSALWTDVGDVALEGLTAETACNAIYTAIDEQLATDAHVLSLGGDHSVSFPVIHAYSQTYQPLDVLHFDAHPDTYDDFEGNPYSHASPFARLMETGRIHRLVQVGIRTETKHTRAQAERFGIETLAMTNYTHIPELVFENPVYLSFDLDALDPAFAPGVSHHEPGGLTTREALNVIASFEGRLVGADVVEYNPDRDVNAMTAMVAAKLAKALLARLIHDNP